MMKSLFTFSLLAILVSPVFAQVKPCGNIEEWDGLYYLEKEEAPYSGICYDYYDNGNLKTKAAFFDGILENRREIQCDKFGNCKTVFHEDFQNNVNNWFTTDEPSVTSSVEKGQLKLQIKDFQAFSRLIEFEINTAANFSIETTMHVTNDDDMRNGQGLVFGFRNWSNYTSFEVNGNGAFTIRGKYDGVIKVEKKWTTPRALNIDERSNTLKVSKVGTKLHYSINGYVVHTGKFDRWDGIYVGFLGRGRKDLAFDNLIVKEDLTLDDPMLTKEDQKMIKKTLWTNNGTGVVISKEGHIITSLDLVKNMDEIEVLFDRDNDIKAYKAELLTSDNKNDLALIKIKDDSFVPFDNLPYNLKTDVSEVFEKTISLSYPMGESLDMQLSVVDAQVISNGVIEGIPSQYETSKPMDPASTGGPTFDGSGNLIGISNARMTNKEKGGYALKAKYINNLVAKLPRRPEMPKSKELASKSPQEQLNTLRHFVPLVAVR